MNYTRELIDTEAAFNVAMCHIQSVETVCMDTETCPHKGETALDWRTNAACGISLLAGNRSFYFPFRHGTGRNLPIGRIREITETVLHPDRMQIGLNYIFDIRTLLKDGMRMPNWGRMRDAQLAAHLMNENEPAYKMEKLAAKYLGDGYAESEDVLIDMVCDRFQVPKKGAKGHMWRLNPGEVSDYACQDVITTHELDQFYRPILRTWGLEELAVEVFDWQLVTGAMEIHGIPFNRARLQEIGDASHAEAEQLLVELHRMSTADGFDHGELNPNSPKQIKYWLKTLAGIPIADTAKDTLLLHDDPRIRTLLAYRQAAKLMGTYVNPLMRYSEFDGRIHPELMVRGTRSSRLSSRNPNFQNQPPVIKSACYAPEGYKFVELDYSQAELRLAAHYYAHLGRDVPDWADKALRAAQVPDYTLGRILLDPNGDMHQQTADRAQVDRKSAKVRNFAIQYGAGAKMLAHRYQTDVRKELDYLQAYNATFPGMKAFSHMCAANIRKMGYMRMWSGRPFRLPKNKAHNASNRIIQGGIAEMVRTAITRVAKEHTDFIPVITVHDSLGGLIPVDNYRERVRSIQATMQDQPWCDLPMFVDAKAGDTWGDAEDLPRVTDGIPPAVLRLLT